MVLLYFADIYVLEMMVMLRMGGGWLALLGGEGGKGGGMLGSIGGMGRDGRTLLGEAGEGGGKAWVKVWEVRAEG